MCGVVRSYFKQFKDQLLQSYCKGREKCLQVTLVCGNGSAESLQHNNVCCDVCMWSQCPHTRLDILQTKKQKPQKQSVAHDMTPSHVKELKTKLSEEREKIFLEHPSYRMIGIDFVCPDIALDKVCEQSKYFSSIIDEYVLNSETSCLVLL